MNYDIQSALKRYFGYNSFKTGQSDIIDSILAGQDTLGIMPTGGGKSICYQLPALLQPGLSLVISPLIALMKDQVDALNELGITAACLNSSMEAGEVRRCLVEASQGHYKILYVAPERLASEVFTNLLRNLPVSLIAIDEAHCVSQWGHDFRPSYLQIAPWIADLPSRPTVAAFTATATQQVRDDIIKLLKLSNPDIYVTGFKRENLHLSAAKGVDKTKFITRYIDTHPEQAGIIYAATRKEVDALYEHLHSKGYSVGRYHAGMNHEERQQNQEDFLFDETRIIVATNAFGLGIDKSNVRYVIHHNMPRHLEAYYQEAGRAGRDGEQADCILLYAPGDVQIQKYLIENSDLDEARKSGEYKKLQSMIDYCHSSRCLQQYILNYFGEEDAANHCGNCANCGQEYEVRDITIEAQKIFSCMLRMQEQYGMNLVAGVLKGSKNKRILNLGFDRLSTYGIMSEMNIPAIVDLMHLLEAEEYIYNTGGQYPVIRLLPKANPVLRGKERVLVKMPRVPETAAPQSDLFDLLRIRRKEIAGREGVPPYVIFHDSTLKEMSCRVPRDQEEMLDIPGVGENKLKKYGQQFLEVIQGYIK
ncbi:DNA helicase, ATP-dependent, RecQ type, bacterial [Syntrophomonas zehnderi OL-4]|uniref:DNA helicase RecQ n=1 Tax=Syntrophomonas zehnderi OL-4 TaxID=690567 RepID=A0A0E4C8B8_9FIRM|nr:DNA helicase RecQ [Syntrophomonas zehnderi]CFX06128.1 DNA helicase, ATP-dependent, RecQ type, bacterial [Syntrophomonas zehnderi OL-4]CFX33684.1 DNA helicase, ATP-dependent, RecQ type, bacterial [Syntrophomonas zehnderi OL-4]